MSQSKELAILAPGIAIERTKWSGPRDCHDQIIKLFCYFEILPIPIMDVSPWTKAIFASILPSRFRYSSRRIDLKSAPWALP